MPPPKAPLFDSVNEYGDLIAGHARRRSPIPFVPAITAVNHDGLCSRSVIESRRIRHLVAMRGSYAFSIGNPGRVTRRGQ